MVCCVNSMVFLPGMLKKTRKRSRMAKTKSAWFCQSCGYESAKWLGKCPSCNSWNSFAEEVTVKGGSQSPGSPGSRQGSPGRINQPVRISEIEFSPEYRIRTGDTEFDRVLGGGDRKSTRLNSSN